MTVQLRGSSDDLVSPDDSIDVVSGRELYHIYDPLPVAW